MPEPPNQPLYLKIKSDILSLIKSGKLKPEDKLPTEHQLMKQYNVSRITVSRALKELKEEGIIIRFPNKGTFVAKSDTPPSLMPASSIPEAVEELSMPLTEIACILPSLTDMFSLSMVNGVLSVFPEDLYICHIFPSRNPATENYLLQTCLERKISGIILFPQDQPYFSNQLLYMQLQKYPLVLLDRYLPRLDTSYVIADNHKAGELCLRHLHELGHRRVVFFTSTRKDTFTVKFRIAGVMAAAEAFNMPEDAVTIIDNVDRTKAFEHYQREIHNLIRNNKITAFITAESSTCSYLYDLLTSMTFKVPGDISIVSFDKPANDNVSPSFFTHISQSEHLMGRKAGMILKNRLENEDMNVYHKAITPTLEIRESTKPVIR